MPQVLGLAHRVHTPRYNTMMPKGSSQMRPPLLPCCRPELPACARWGRLSAAGSGQRPAQGWLPWNHGQHGGMGKPPWPVSAAGCLLAGLDPGLGCGPRGHPKGLRLGKCVLPGLWDGPQGRASLGPLSLLWPSRRAVPPRPLPWLVVSAAEVQPSGPLSQSHLCVVPHTAEPAGLFCRCLCPCWPGVSPGTGSFGRDFCSEQAWGWRPLRTSSLEPGWCSLRSVPRGWHRHVWLFKAGPGRSAALSPVTCMKGQQPQHPPSPRCHRDMGSTVSAPTQPTPPPYDTQKMCLDGRAYRFSVSLKMTKLPAFLSSLRGMQAKEKMSPISCFKQ